MAAIRAFHRAGWDVGVGTPDPEPMVGRSRRVSATHVIPRPRGEATTFVAAIQRAVDERGYDVAFGGADDWMAALAMFRDDLPLTVGHPDWSVVRRGLDKLELAELGSDADLAVPRTVLATDESIAAWQGPVVVKCRSHWFPGQQHALRVEARRFDDVASATTRIAEVRDAGFEPLLQQPIEGRLGAIVGLMHEGRLHGRVQQVATGLWPTPSGVSSRARTVALDEELFRGAEKVLSSIGWTGLVELQFLTPPGGRPHLIDLNGRFYGSMALAIAAGPNLPAAWGQQALDGRVDPDLLPEGRVGLRYIWTPGDLRRALVERRGGVVADVLQTIRWSAGGAVRSVWDLRDPGPFLHLLSARLRSSVGGTVS